MDHLIKLVKVKKQCMNIQIDTCLSGFETCEANVENDSPTSFVGFRLE